MAEQRDAPAGDGTDERQRRPRPPARAPAEAARVRVRNRRRAYLQRHPDYVASSDREFADVARYHRLVRAFQTPAERAAEAQAKGFGQVLEASMLRNPEGLERVGGVEGEVEEEEEEEEGEGQEEGSREDDEARAQNGDDGDDNGDDDDDDDATADGARRAWEAFVRDWFVEGGAADDGFDYAAVDEDSDYDTLARADAEEAWFDAEAPAWAGEGAGEGGGRAGETGIQDF